MARVSGLKATKGVVKAGLSSLKPTGGANIIAGGAQCGFAGVTNRRAATPRIRRRTLKSAGLEKGQSISSHASCFSAPSPSAVAPGHRWGWRSGHRAIFIRFILTNRNFRVIGGNTAHLLAKCVLYVMHAIKPA